MRIEGNNYISSKGVSTPISDLPYPYLINARDKAQNNGDVEAAHILNNEILSRESQPGK